MKPSSGARAAVQGHRCYLCGGEMLNRPGRREEHLSRTTDHVIPLSRGGFDVQHNYLFAHKRCNNLKGDRMPKPCEILYLNVTNEILGSGKWAWMPTRTGRYQFMRKPERRA